MKPISVPVPGVIEYRQPRVAMDASPEIINGYYIYQEGDKFILLRSPHGPLLGRFPTVEMARTTAKQLPGPRRGDSEESEEKSKTRFSGKY